MRQAEGGGLKKPPPLLPVVVSSTRFTQTNRRINRNNWERSAGKANES